MKTIALCCTLFLFCGCVTTPTTPTKPPEEVVDVCPPPDVKLPTEKVKKKADAICKTEDKVSTGLYEETDL